MTKSTKKKGTKKKKFHWDECHQQAFDTIKSTIARDVVLAYPNYEKQFEIYTDASSRQLGAVIVQDNRPISFFSRKLTETQRKYSVTELELLSIVETLNEFRGMLWGQDIKVFTDHLNLTRDALGLTSDRVYRWMLLLEEYGPEIAYIKGIYNIVADAISRLDYDPTINPDHRFSHYVQKLEANRTIEEGHVKLECVKWHTVSHCFVQCLENSVSPTETDIAEKQNSSNDDYLNVFAAAHTEEEDIYPLTISEIVTAQKEDKHLRKLFKRGGENKSKNWQLSSVANQKVVTDKNMKLVITK